MTAEPERSPEPTALELTVARFRLLARARAAWLRRGREEVTEIDALLDDRDSPEAEAEWVARSEWVKPWAAELRAVEAALVDDRTSRLAGLRQIFGLSAEEQDLLEACLAVSLDPSLGRLCAYLHDHAGREYMTENLAARLYRHGRCGVWNAESALYRWELILVGEPGAGGPRALECDPQIREWLLGRSTLHEALVGIAHLREALPAPGSWPVRQTAGLIESRVKVAPPGRVRIAVEGARGSGRRTFAAGVSAELGMPLVEIDAGSVSDAEWRRLYLLAQRHAYLERCALAWQGDTVARRAWPALSPPFPVQFAIVEGAGELTPLDGVSDLRVRMPSLTIAERSELWRTHVPASREWPDAEFRALTERYRVHAGDIVAVAEAGVVSAEEAGLRVREATRGRLGNLAQWLQCGFAWDDLVAPADLKEALEDIVYEASHRAAFWEQSEAQRLFPQGRGLMALFSGPPGTGKTMAAQVMAARLGYDLFRVDLAGVVSKWVGETSQNFERILTRAADMHAMLLFDECDAIFAKRTTEVRDAQDKFANTDAAYLLQAIESYPGMAVLATNQKGNIDPAFIRRLRYVLEFEKPDAAQRLEIWRKVVTAIESVGLTEALDAPIKTLADSVEATGAQIKFAVLGAGFAARREGGPLELRHLLRGLDRELGKEGRALGTRERERILNHAR
jgi:adenylate kinase family enzyme